MNHFRKKVWVHIFSLHEWLFFSSVQIPHERGKTRNILDCVSRMDVPRLDILSRYVACDHLATHCEFPANSRCDTKPIASKLKWNHECVCMYVCDCEVQSTLRMAPSKGRVQVDLTSFARNWFFHFFPHDPGELVPGSVAGELVYHNVMVY